MNKIPKKLCKLRKEKNITKKTYFEVYPSDSIPPRLYDTNQKKTLAHVSHCIYHRYTALWNIKTSCRYH